MSHETGARLGLEWISIAALLGLAVWGVSAWVGLATANHRHGHSAAVISAAEVVPAPAPADPAAPAEPTAPAVLAVSIASRVDSAWLDRVSSGTGIPRRALAAYAGASLALATERPGCHLGWSTLAAIGHVESDDGRHGGGVVSDTGYPSLPIVGPALDGGAFAGIHDSDGGEWDGDRAWDHAVGPFQFIPQTWRAWGADGNGDGLADPNQFDDAALTAARYLCHAGDLSSVDGWRRAVRSYNHSDSYVDEIARVANSYRS
ncbi:lytic transglycosylase domain-containing protein [Lacisediminihabitans profunda]|uniref:lytic transglycosylase domain-containing protein n=1 Tax=Lacisediminihabitans profunda TaxID=2594790 RepID=UPI001FE80CEC|nr:lytic murein transglycosylase [Lacisediminihabitans profunda]